MDRTEMQVASLWHKPVTRRILLRDLVGVMLLTGVVGCGLDDGQPRIMGPEGPPPTFVVPASARCQATVPMNAGPHYLPNAPQRASVGTGHLLRGHIRSVMDCSTIQNAQIEFWMAGPSKRYDDAFRATQFSDSDGAYSFESHFPLVYDPELPPHIHIKVSAEGYRSVITEYQPPSEQSTEGEYDIVLVPVNV